MKTIDEAMELVVKEFPSGSNPKEMLVGMKELIDRRESIAKEVAGNESVHLFLNAYLDGAHERFDGNVGTLALNIFINGVLIGMEMERQEL